MIYHYGYGADIEGKRLEGLMRDPQMLLIDTRMSPACNLTKWTKAGLKAQYGARYRWAGESLGNIYYHRPEKGIVLADWSFGLDRLRFYQESGHNVTLLCGCGNYTKCHRKVIMEKFLMEAPDLLSACISIKQPFSWIITHPLDFEQGHFLPKTIENREQDTAYRGKILIHAGKTPNPGFFTGKDKHLMDEGWHTRFGMPSLFSEYETGGIVGEAELIDVVTESDNPWFKGTYGYVLKDARVIPFVPYNGSLYVFGVPPLREGVTTR